MAILNTDNAAVILSTNKCTGPLSKASAVKLNIIMLNMS